MVTNSCNNFVMALMLTVGTRDVYANPSFVNARRAFLLSLFIIFLSIFKRRTRMQSTHTCEQGFAEHMYTVIVKC
jgi:hypothetical protein